MSFKTPYKRVLLKLSGEALTDPDDSQQNISQKRLKKVVADIKAVYDLGIEICLVVGAGNIYRGVKGALECGIDRATSDYMGMLATVINALALQNAFETGGISCRVMTSIPMSIIAEYYNRHRALRHLAKKRIVIFAAGTGNPFFTTDTAAALRSSEMGCDLLLKATKVKGVYSSDPIKNPQAIFYPTLSYKDVIQQDLKVMDSAAFTLTKENQIPIAVFSLYEDNGFLKTIQGKGQFTLIH
ncbi:MAG: UMP kinase [Proteobacteria bacterium]|nr:UMP kinase [Pseudomonadota bacterium]